MSERGISNDYEEARKHRLEQNKKKLEDLGVSSILKSMTDHSNSEKKSQRLSKPKSNSIYTLEPRRSSRARNPVRSYIDDVDTGLPRMRKRSRSSSSSWASYIARPLDEIKTASYEERAHAINVAEDLRSNLQSGHPSFVKSMVRSHVYSCFWLGLPSNFCKKHLPKVESSMVLEDENGTEYNAIYISKRVGLSGGWRAFALDHKLDDGDALVFELIERTRFKIYIVKGSLPSSKEGNAKISGKEGTVGAKKEVTVSAKKTSKGGTQVEESRRTSKRISSYKVL